MKKIKLSTIAFLLLVFSINSYGQLFDKTIYIQPVTDTNMVNLAEELAEYLLKIESNEYAVNTSDNFNGTGILLAVRQSTDVLSAADNTTLSGMNGEVFLSDINNDQVIIVGNFRIGVQHGIFDFVKQLGCKFLTPSPD